MLSDIAIGEQPLGAYSGGSAFYPGPFSGQGSLKASLRQIITLPAGSIQFHGRGSMYALAHGGISTPPGLKWQLGPPEMRFYWTVHVGLASLTWFRVTKGQCGVDPHLLIGTALDLECMINRFKPAHTEVVFDYSSLEAGGPMAGTP